MWNLREGLSQKRRPNERAYLKINAKLAIRNDQLAMRRKKRPSLLSLPRGGVVDPH
jgi:hypothetical protein